MERVFIDADIVLDLLAARHPHLEAAAALFSLSDNKEIELYVSALSFSNIHYILARETNEKEARRYIAKLKILVKVLAVDDKIIQAALFSDFKDFEDAIQYYTALEGGISILLTRNLKDYRLAEIPVMTAEQYMKLRS